MSDSTESNQHYTLQEVAAFFNCGYKHVLTLVESGALKGIDISGQGSKRRMWRVSSSALEAFKTKDTGQPLGSWANRKEDSMPKLRDYNTSKVIRNRNVYYRARLTFKYDDALGYKPKPKDFLAKTMREAIAKRDAYIPENPNLDKETLLVSYVRDVYLPELIKRNEAGKLDLHYCKAKCSQLQRFLIQPNSLILKKTRIRQVALGRLSPMVVTEYYDAMRTVGVPQHIQKRLRDSLLDIFRTKKRFMTYKPLEYFEDANVPGLPKNRHSKEVFTPEELFAVINDKRHYIESRVLIAFQFFIQCRPSEMFALTPEDINLQDGSVLFNKVMKQNSKGYQVTPGTKTGAEGIRRVRLGLTLTRLLQELFDARNATGRPNNWVFQTLSGGPLNNGNFRNHFLRIRAELGLRDGPSFYSMKTTGNSFAKSQGVTDKAQQDKMGHTSPRMSQENYRTILTSESYQAIAVFDQQSPSMGTE